MKLHFNAASPYTRKVCVLAHEMGLSDQITLDPITVWTETDKIRKDNPLGKVPTLVLDDGTAMYDSAVICAYLDSLHNGPKLIPAGDDRWPVELRHALANGMTDAALSLRADVMRGRDTEAGYPDSYAERMWETIVTGLGEAERTITDWQDKLDLGTVALGVLCGYLDLRFNDRNWRQYAPKVAEWFADFDQRSSMQAFRAEG